jgi:hypothetical protein
VELVAHSVPEKFPGANLLDGFIAEEVDRKVGEAVEPGREERRERQREQYALVAR